MPTLFYKESSLFMEVVLCFRNVSNEAFHHVRNEAKLVQMRARGMIFSKLPGMYRINEPRSQMWDEGFSSKKCFCW